MKLRKSLLMKYLGVLGIYVLLAPILNFILILGIVMYEAINISDQTEGAHLPRYTYHAVEEDWHQSAHEMADLTEEERIEALRQLKKRYPESTVFWVNDKGDVRLKLPEDAAIPDQWTTTAAVQFMKESVNADPFTVVALIGEGDHEGFMAIQIPRSEFTVPAGASFPAVLTPIVYIMIVVGMNIGLFIFLSWLYFARIRRRLTTLRTAMKDAKQTGEFPTVPVRQADEIADLERSFNEMAWQLKESHKREQEEEQLRRELIANLSHDLRTPLTVIRGHAYSLGQEDLSQKGKRSLEAIDAKIRYLGELIDNLLSFTLLTAGKYPYNPEKMDVVRLLRIIVASWYPVLEKEGFEIDVQLPEQPVYWEVDEQWFHRIWDNVFQNVLRYAREGRFVAVSIEKSSARTCLILEDRGPGMDATNVSKGAGIGLSIVSLMAEEMNMQWYITSSEKGTRCSLCKEDLC